MIRAKITNTKTTLLLLYLILGLYFTIITLTHYVYALDFYGYTYDKYGNVLNNTNVTVLVVNMTDWTNIETKSQLSANGFFNISNITDCNKCGYKVVVAHYNNNTNHTYTDYVSKPLPYFMYHEFKNVHNVTFYLQEGATINLSIIADPMKRENASVVQSYNLNMSVVPNISNIIGLEWINDTGKWSYISYSSPPMPGTYYLVILNHDFSINSTRNLSYAQQVADFDYLNNYYFVLNRDPNTNVTQILKYQDNTTNLILNHTYNLSQNYTKIFSIEYDYCNDNNMYYIVVDLANNNFSVEHYFYNQSQDSFVFINRTPIDLAGWLERPNCDSWYLVTPSDPNTNVSDIFKLRPDFSRDSPNDHWDTNFSAKGAEFQNDTLYVLCNNDNTTKALSLYKDRAFDYIIKDTRLGYELDEYFSQDNNGAKIYSRIINLPEHRNYTIMVFPEKSMPTTYHLNNLSDYGGYAEIAINTSEGFIWVSGFAKKQDGTANFTDLHVIPYLVEPGDAISVWSAMPANMSSWRGDGSSDTFDPVTGFFNITLVAKSMPSKVILFIVGTDESEDEDYIMYKNITTQMNNDMFIGNITLYPAAGDYDFNISQHTGQGDDVVTTVTGFKFIFVNESNGTIHDPIFTEIILNYTSLGGTMFEWRFDVPKENNGTFTLPLIYNTSIRKMRIFSQKSAPMKKSFDASQLVDVDNLTITLRSFNPGDIKGELNKSQIFIDMIKSNDVCNVPNYNKSLCSLLPKHKQNMKQFDPLSVVMGGAPMSFVMGKLENNTPKLIVMYKNVDLLASGPPDVMFDSRPNSSTSNNTMEEIWRFGSHGPEIYDEVLLGIPISPNVSIANLRAYIGRVYDENFNVVWNTSMNLSDLPPDFSDFNETLFNDSGMPCSTTDSNLSQGFCYIDTTHRMLWIKIPHFSGVGSTLEGQQAQPPQLLYNSTNTTSVLTGQTILISTRWNDTTLNTSNLTCELYVDGTLNQSINSSGEWCNFTYTTTASDHPSVVFYVKATNIDELTSISSNMSVQVNISCATTVTSNLTLYNNLNCSSGSNGLIIGASGIVIDCNGHFIAGDGNFTDSNPYYGIFGDGYDNITIKNCNIRLFSAGISLYNSTGHNINNNNISYNSYEAGGSSGIVLQNVNSSILSNNYIHDNDVGIHLINSNYNVIFNNNIRNNNLVSSSSYGYGLFLESGSNNNISSNTFYNNSVAGLQINTSNNIIINNNMSENGLGMNSSEAENTWRITSRVRVVNNNITIRGNIIFTSDGILEVINSYIRWNSTLINKTNINFTSLSLSTSNIGANSSVEQSFDDVRTNITLYFTTNKSLTISLGQVSVGSSPSGYNTLRQISIELNDTSGLGWVMIKLYYNESELADNNINESSLKIYYYNESTSPATWQLVPNQGVNTTANYVWANLTHLSIYGAFGKAQQTSSSEEEEESSDSGSSSSSGGANIILNDLGNIYPGTLKSYVLGTATNYFTFNYDGVTHTVRLNNISDDKSWIMVTITSRTIKLKMFDGKTYKLDINNNGYYDIETWTKIINKYKARVYIKGIEETEKVSVSEETSTQTSDQLSEQNQTQQLGITNQTNATNQTSIAEQPTPTTSPVISEEGQETGNQTQQGKTTATKLKLGNIALWVVLVIVIIIIIILLIKPRQPRPLSGLSGPGLSGPSVPYYGPKGHEKGHEEHGLGLTMHKEHKGHEHRKHKEQRKHKKHKSKVITFEEFEF